VNIQNLKRMKSYAAEWAEYKHLRNCAIYSAVAVFAAPFLAVALLGLLLRFPTFQFLTHLGMLPFLIGVALMGSTLFYAYLHYAWQCPRCGERFGRLHEECQNCALPKWAIDDSDLSQRADSPNAKWPKPRI
jgi:hypothetical protein